MSLTRAEFETLRDNNWGDTAPVSPSTPLRDPVCDRNVFDKLMDEFFSPEIHEYDGNSNTIIGSAASGVSFSFRFKKLGNNVFIYGQITNTSGSTIGTTTALVTITDTKYIRKNGTGAGLSAVLTSALTTTVLNYGMGIDGTFKSFNPLPTGNSLIFSGRYTVND